MDTEYKDDNKNDLICEQCGAPNASYGLDPYSLDVHNTEVEVCWCDNCFYESAMDI